MLYSPFHKMRQESVLISEARQNKHHQTLGAFMNEHIDLNFYPKKGMSDNILKLENDKCFITNFQNR